MSTIFQRLPDDISSESISVGRGTGELLCSKPVLGGLHGCFGLVPRDLQQFLSIERRGHWWCRPRVGKSLVDLAPFSMDGNKSQIQLFLWQRRDHSYAAVVPLISGSVRSYLTGPAVDGEGLTIVSLGLPANSPNSGAAVLLAATGDQPFELIEDLLETASRWSGTFTRRERKDYPEIFEYLGWCSWEAFSFDVTAGAVVDAMASLRGDGIRPRWVLIDDGWMQVDSNDALEDFAASPERFPDGLEGLVRQLKGEFAVCEVGVWLTLQGYWNGVGRDGPWHDLLVLETHRKRKTLKGQPVDHSYFVNPDDAWPFFDRWFRALRRQSIGMIKVDGQSNMDQFLEEVLPLGESVEKIQHAVQGAAAVHFGNRMIACMCHSSETLMSGSATSVIRNSPDHSHAERHFHFHQPHLVNNGFNALLVGEIGWTDWDMFTTTESPAEFHAMGRAISGGPVYISDAPGSHNPEIVEKLTIRDGRILRNEGPARPSRDRLFVDCLAEPKLLKLWNRHADHAVLGLFHCQWSEDVEKRTSITDSFKAADAELSSDQPYAIFFHRARLCELLAAGDEREIQLPFMTSELVTFSPIVRMGEVDFGVFGLIDKFNPSVAIQSWQIASASAFCSLVDGGRVGFYASKPPKRVTCGSASLEFQHDPNSCLLTVFAPAGRRMTLALEF